MLFPSSESLFQAARCFRVLLGDIGALDLDAPPGEGELVPSRAPKSAGAADVSLSAVSRRASGSKGAGNKGHPGTAGIKSRGRASCQTVPSQKAGPTEGCVLLFVLLVLRVSLAVSLLKPQDGNPQRLHSRGVRFHRSDGQAACWTWTFNASKPWRFASDGCGCENRFGLPFGLAGAPTLVCLSGAVLVKNGHPVVD